MTLPGTASLCALHASPFASTSCVRARPVFLTAGPCEKDAALRALARSPVRRWQRGVEPPSPLGKGVAESVEKTVYPKERPIARMVHFLTLYRFQNTLLIVKVYHKGYPSLFGVITRFSPRASPSLPLASPGALSPRGGAPPRSPPSVYRHLIDAM